MQYYEDLGSSVVAIRYESFLSPAPSKIQDTRKSVVALTQVASNLVAQNSEANNHHHQNTEDVLKPPITFLPLPSPHLGGSMLRFPKIFKKIEEMPEEENSQKLFKKNSDIQTSKKKFFEEFFVIGLDKEDFMKKVDWNKTNDGFCQAKILYCYEGEEVNFQDWYVYFIGRDFN